MSAQPQTERRDEFIQAARKIAFRTDDGREIIHSFRGFIGADCDLVGVIQSIRSARSVEWGPDLLGHELRVIEEGGHLVRFDLRRHDHGGV